MKFISNKLFSSIETDSDIVSILRHCCKPKEILIECAFQEENHSINIKNIVHQLKTFLINHKYEPSTIYEDFGEELKQIPSPEIEPLQVIADFLEILNIMGPYCADKAALSLIFLVEKLKMKVPYERHYTLLCNISTLLIQIRSIFDDIFLNYSMEDRIFKFSSPRVLRLIDTLKQFKPKSYKADDDIKVHDDRKEKKKVFIKSKLAKRNWKLARRYGTNKKQGRVRDLYEENVCAIIFVNNRLTASILYYLFLVSINILLIKKVDVFFK